MVNIWVSSAACLLWTVAQVLGAAQAADQMDTAAANADEAAQALQALEEATKRAGFLPMRGRRGPDLVDTEADKRGGSSFMPMRGRKDFPDQDTDDSADKRGSAFLPSRGRKDDPFMDESEDKRASSFMPMRGRKDDANFKRLSSFLPMRGRKAYGIAGYPALSDMRGRKKAFGSKRLNSAFMPMRGKKEDDEAPDGLDDELQDEDKRAAGSFFGMRGKRQASAPKVASKREALFFATRGKRTTA